MKKAIYPGSFDPVTYGHLDVIRRASTMFDELVVSVLNNKGKSPLFSVEERVKMLQESTKDLSNVKITSFSGLIFILQSGGCVPLPILSMNYRLRRPIVSSPMEHWIRFS